MQNGKESIRVCVGLLHIVHLLTHGLVSAKCPSPVVLLSRTFRYAAELRKRNKVLFLLCCVFTSKYYNNLSNWTLIFPFSGKYTRI